MCRLLYHEFPKKERAKSGSSSLVVSFLKRWIRGVKVRKVAGVFLSGGFSRARPCTVIYFAYGVLADTILNFQLGGISGGITVFKRRPASHAPPAVGDLSVQ